MPRLLPAIIPRRAAAIAVPLVGMALAGELAHRWLVYANALLLHHLFHILYGVGALLVFAGLVAHDVRRHGWPGFSWRLDGARTSSSVFGANSPRERPDNFVA